MAKLWLIPNKSFDFWSKAEDQYLRAEHLRLTAAATTMDYQHHDLSNSSDLFVFLNGVLPDPHTSPNWEDEETSVTVSRRQSDDSRRAAVPVACLRCRRRKVRCSGLPGPCDTCAKFGVSCVDPGKRRSRSRSISGSCHFKTGPSQQPDEVSQLAPRHEQLRIQTVWDDVKQDSIDDLDSMPVSPAYYSDLGPDLDTNWPQSGSDAQSDYFAGLARAQTLPNQSSCVFNEQLHSPIPSIQITSDRGSVTDSPLLQPDFDMQMYTLQQELPPLQIPVSTSMDYYSDFLSPTDQPPPISRRVSSNFGNNTSQIEDWTQKTGPPAKRRHTTCSVSNPRLVENNELIWMLKSPRTSNYLRQYLEKIHPHYPFLDTSDIESHTQLAFSSFTNSFSWMKAYQRLVTAAIGAMQQHNSRDIAARYVRHAMTLQKNEDLDLFGSISGVHCAMLLAIYLLLEAQTEFGLEEEDTSHPYVNLWLWNCRITAACIDLGLHEWPRADNAASTAQLEQQERATAVLCLNTFQSSWFLDQEISNRCKRPRALHAEDVDAEMLDWIVNREQVEGLSLPQHVNRENIAKSLYRLNI